MNHPIHHPFSSYMTTILLLLFWFLLIIGNDEHGFLHIIEESHVDMVKMYENVREIVQSNWYGPKIYLHPIYRYYFVLLARKMKLITEKIFTQRTIPDLPVRFLKNIYFIYIFYYLDTRFFKRMLTMLSMRNFITMYDVLLKSFQFPRILCTLLNFIFRSWKDFHSKCN